MQPVLIDRVLTRIVAGGAPTVANDALRYMSRMFRMAVRNHGVDRNPAADFDLVDAGGDEVSRDRWLTVEELQQLAAAIRTTRLAIQQRANAQIVHAAHRDLVVGGDVTRHGRFRGSSSSTVRPSAPIAAYPTQTAFHRLLSSVVLDAL